MQGSQGVNQSAHLRQCLCAGNGLDCATNLGALRPSDSVVVIQRAVDLAFSVCDKAIIHARKMQHFLVNTSMHGLLPLRRWR